MKRAPIKSLPSRDELLRLFSYDHVTGILLWRIRSGPCRACSVAGTVGAKGYVVVGIDGVYYLAHRIIWKMMTGNDPGEFIDHENGDKVDLRWENLRPATNGQNIQNSKLRRDNKSGVKGVCWDSYHKKWTAQVTVNGETIRVGRFVSVEEAAAEITEARVRLHGEFARAA